MKTITKFTDGSLNAKLVNAFANKEFLTGAPIRVFRAWYLNKKLQAITFLTERGVEDFYTGDALCAAKADSDTVIMFI